MLITSPTISARKVAAQIDRDLEQPRLESQVGARARERSIGVQERVLRDVLGLGPVARQTERQVKERRGVTRDEFGKGLRIAEQRLPDQSLVAGWHCNVSFPVGQMLRLRRERCGRKSD